LPKARVDEDERVTLANAPEIACPPTLQMIAGWNRTLDFAPLIGSEHDRQTIADKREESR